MLQISSDFLISFSTYKETTWCQGFGLSLKLEISLTPVLTLCVAMNALLNGCVP